MNGLHLTSELPLLMLLVLILALVSVVLSITSLLLVRSAARKITSAPQPVTPHEIVQTTPSAPSPRAIIPRPPAVKAEVKPPLPKLSEDLEIKPAEVGEEFGFASLGEVTSMLGIKSAILFNQSGIPIDSYNISEDDRVAASVADFVSLIRKLNPGFSYMVSEGDQRVMLFVVGRIGESEIYALTVGGGPEFGVEEVRDMLRAYLAESLGRFK